MTVMEFFRMNWPLLALAAWFGYKWWKSKKVVAMLPALREKGAMLVDVRSAAEFAAGNAPGTVNIPMQELSARLGEIPKSAPVVVGCASGSRSGVARMMLKKHGYTEVYNIGGWRKFLN